MYFYDQKRNVWWIDTETEPKPMFDFPVHAGLVALDTLRHFKWQSNKWVADGSTYSNIHFPEDVLQLRHSIIANSQ